MKSQVLLVVAALAIAVLYVELRLPVPGKAPESSPDRGADLAPLTRRIGALERSIEEQGAEIRALREARAEAAAKPAAAPPKTEAPAGPPPVTKEEAGKRAAKVDEFLASLARGEVTTEALDELWNVLPGSGREKAVVDAMTAYLKEHPDDADAHYGLGVALTNLFLGGKVSQVEIMSLSARADAEFTKALAIDDHHFSARFSKAVSYTFYPSIAGVGPEAIRQFEILRSRHGGDSSNEMMREVYFNLGKEYQKAGNFDKAREVFGEGLGVFPGDERMKSQLEAMGR